MKIRLVTVIWGEAFVDMFLRIGLRSLLAEGNIVDLAQRHRAVYTIYTTPEDARRIEAAPAFTALRETVEVRFSLFSPQEIDASHYGSHGSLWLRGIELARRNRETLFFIIPDLLYAAGTLVRWAEKFNEGYRAIYSPGPQVVLETILPELEAGRRDGLAISIGLPEINRLLLQHLHPIHTGVMRDTGHRVCFPEYDIRPVKDHGIVFRELSAQPFCLDPSYFGPLVNFNPAQRLDAIAFEPVSALSVEPLFKRLEWYYRPWSLDATALSQIGAWWDYFGPPGCVRDSAEPRTVTLADTPTWRRESLRAALEGRFFRAQMAVACTIFRIVAALRQKGFARAADMLSAAEIAAIIRRRIAAPSGATLLIPCDEAFQAATMDRLQQLLTPGREAEFAKLVANHVVFRSETSDAPDSWLTASGVPFQMFYRAHVLSGPIDVAGFKAYVIDRVLDNAAYASGAIVLEAAQSPEKAPPFIARPISRLLGIEGYSAWAQRSLGHKVLYLLLHLPVIEPFVALIFPVYFRRGLGAIANRLNGSWKQATQGLLPARLRNLIQLVEDKKRAQGTRATILAVVKHTTARVLGKSRGEGALLRIFAAIDFSTRAVRYLHAYGLRAFIRRARLSIEHRRRRGRQVERAAAPPSVVEVSELSLALFNEVRLARGLAAMRDSLRHFSDRVLPSDVPSRPLAMVESWLAAPHLSDVAIAQALKELSSAHPDWAECWLELGHLYVDLMRPEDALASYRRASAGRILSSDLFRCRDPRADARAESAKMLASADRLDDAAREYAASLALEPDQAHLRGQYGDLLRRLGRMNEALEQFASAISFDERRWCVPQVGRDASILDFPILLKRSAILLAEEDGPTLNPELQTA